MWVCSIGAVYNKMGENEKALGYYNKSLEIKIKVLGQDHPLVASTLGNIALIYQQQGKLSEALESFEKILAMFEKIHGPDHPVVADTKVCPQQCMSYMKLCMF